MRLAVVAAAVALVAGLFYREPHGLVVALLLVAIRLGLVTILRRPKEEVAWWALFALGLIAFMGLRGAALALG